MENKTVAYKVTDSENKVTIIYANDLVTDCNGWFRFKSFDARCEPGELVSIIDSKQVKRIDLLDLTRLSEERRRKLAESVKITFYSKKKPWYKFNF